MSNEALLLVSDIVLRNNKGSDMLTPDKTRIFSDFNTNSYGESWDSRCEEFWVPVHNHQWVRVQKNKPS